MGNVINRINNEFGFNYQKFVRNNNISEVTAIKPIDSKSTKFNSSEYSRPVEVETMNFDAMDSLKKKEIEILHLND